MSTIPSLCVALVDDHELIVMGFRELASRHPSWKLVSTARTVDGLLGSADQIDIAVLDLRLEDGSDAAANIGVLREAGARVVAYTASDDVELIRRAARAGVMCVVRKSEPLTTLAAAIEAAAEGRTLATTEWAAALDGDLDLAPVRLSPREREILALYAAGETASDVAAITGLSRETVADYVGRIRTKYSLAGRQAKTRIELYLRAREDGLFPDEDSFGTTSSGWRR